MDITLRPLEIDESTGFDPNIDIFGRKAFGERLTKLLTNTNQPLTLGLDARWGEGKSTFVKMWQGYLRSPEVNVNSVYFDAFETDFQSDAFLTISREIYQLIDDRSGTTKEEYLSKAKEALKVVAKISTRVAIKGLTAGVLDETILESQSGEVGDQLASASDDYLKKKIASAESDQHKIQQFKKCLAELPETLKTDKPIIIVIDELDRCRPDYAIDIIESIKHFFSIPNIHFVLVMNRGHLESAISHRYGVESRETSEYLQKFVNIWATLPFRRRSGQKSNRRKYLLHCLKAMNFKPSGEEISVYEELVEHFSLSFREIEQSLTSFAIIENSGTRKNSFGTSVLTPLLVILKLKYPMVYGKLMRKANNYSDLIQEVGLQSLENNSWKSGGISPSHPVTWSLQLCLSENVSQFQHQVNKAGWNSIDVQDSHEAISELLDVLEEFTYVQ